MMWYAIRDPQGKPILASLDKHKSGAWLKAYSDDRYMCRVALPPSHKERVRVISTTAQQLGYRCVAVLDFSDNDKKTLPLAHWSRIVEILENIEIISTSDNDAWDELHKLLEKCK